MIKVTFYYKIGGHTVLVKAKARKVTETTVKGLSLGFYSEDGTDYDHVMDRDTFTDIEEQAIEELQLSI